MWFKRKRIWSGKILLLLVILLLGLTLLGCAAGRGQPKGWSGGTVADGTLFLGSLEGKLVALDVSSGARLWMVPLETSAPASGGFGCAGGSTTVAIYGTPAVAGDLVYVGSYVKTGTRSSGRIYAFSLDRDEPRWVYPRDGYLTEPVVGGLVVSQGKVYFGGSDGKVYALDAADGYKIGEWQTGEKIWSTPAVDGDTVYIGSFDKKLHVLDATSLEPTKWREFETEGAIVATPLIYEGIIYIGSFDRHLYAVDATSGKQIWKFPASDEDKDKAESWFWAKPIAYNGVIYAPCLDGKVYVLDAKKGEELAEAIDMESPIASSPVLVDSLIIVATEEGRVYSLDTTSNQKRELANLEEKVYALLSASEGTVFIHTEKDALYALEWQTGAIREFHVE